MSDRALTEARPISTGVRRLTMIISGLAFVVGPLLFLFPDATDRFFAWTIKPGLTAAVLGANYSTALLLEVIASRQTLWARVRVFYPGMLVFTAVTLVATILHLDRFNFESPAIIARLATWAWTVIYILAPVLMLGLLIRQLRVPGREPTRHSLIPLWYRAVLGAQAVVMIANGLFMFLAPSIVASWWPWTLTALTAQAISAWYVGLGLGAGAAAGESDWDNIFLAIVGNLAFAILQIINVLRFSENVVWSSPFTPVYFGSLIVILVIGGYGWIAHRRASISS